LFARSEQELGAPSWDETPADPTAIVPDEQGPEADRLLHQALGRHTFLGEAALVVGWILFSFVVFHFLTVNHRSAASVTLAWLFVGASGVMVGVILAFRRVAERRIRLGLHDAGVALRSIQSVTDPGLSFLPLDALLDELLARTGRVVGGDVATIFLVTASGTSLTVRASYGLDPTFMDLHVRMGEGVVGEVAQRAQAVIVNHVAGASPTSPLLREHVASLVAAPLLVGGQVIGVVQVGTRVHHRFQGRDLQLLQLVADRSAASIERARLDEAERRSRLGAEHARQHVAILARAGDVLATALESYDEAMVRLVEVVVPSFADWFAVDVVDDQGTLRRVAEGAQGRWKDAPGRHPHSDGDALVRQVLASGRPEVVIHTQRAGPPHGGEPALPGEYLETEGDSGIESMLVVPVHLRGLSFGALSFVTGTGRRGYRRSDLETAGGLAERVAIAVERVLLWGESRQAEQAATRHAAQLRRLMEAALAVNAPLAEPQVLRVLSEHGRRVLDAEQAVVLVLPAGDPQPPFTALPTRELATTPAEGAAELEASAPLEVPGSMGPIVRAASRLVARANRPLRNDGGLDQVDDPALTAELASSGPGTVPWMAVPLVDSKGTRNRAIVVLGRARPFNAEDESVLVLLAQMATVALDNARLYQAVQGNEQRLQAVVESSPLAIAELDLYGVARWWNGAAGSLFGWDTPADGALRIPAADEAAASALGRLWDRTRHGEATVGVQLAAHRNDELLQLSVSTAPLLDHEGSVTGILAVAEDVTERQRMLEQFQQAERLGAMARLAGGVAHDFNNLLTVILGCSEILLRRIDSGDPLVTEVEAIQRAGHRAAALTSQLLAIGHRQVGQPGVVDPDGIVRAMEPMLVRVMGEDVQLELVPPDPGGRILVDPAEIERAVLNLAINARDAMPKGGRLVIRTRVVGADLPAPQRIVALAVSDTGTGMDEETAEHCFEPFYTTKGMAKGTGLGLAAVHAMVTQAGGQVSVDTAPGRGTTITLWFPAVEEDESALADAAFAQDSSGGDELVLVVEDEDELRRLAVRELEERGYLVLAAGNGVEALAVAHSLERPIDLLVTDVVMPEMNGVELAESLVALWPSVAVLFVSGHLDEGAMDRHPLDPDADLLPKPFTPDQLGRRARQALDRAAANRRSRVLPKHLRAEATGA
jgi:PAS domain S-box-containing protein